MTTKAQLEKENKKLKIKTDSRIVLLYAITIMAIGLFVLLSTPFFNKWFGVSFKDLAVARISLPSGYAICGIALAIQLINKLPEIVEAFRRTRQ